MTVWINNDVIIGPVSCEHLAYIARYGGNGDNILDILESSLTGQIDSIRIEVKYSEFKNGNYK